MTFGHPCPVSDLFGIGGRQLLDRLEFPEPWRGDIEASLRLIDELSGEVTGIEKDLRATGADHPYVPLLLSLAGAGWILAYTIAAEIGDITRFQSPTKLVGYSGLCPRVYQSGETDHRGSLAKCGPRYLRWALIEAAVHGARHPSTKSAMSAPHGGSVASAAPRSPGSTCAPQTPRAYHIGVLP